MTQEVEEEEEEEEDATEAVGSKEERQTKVNSTEDG